LKKLLSTSAFLLPLFLFYFAMYNNANNDLQLPNTLRLTTTRVVIPGESYSVDQPDQRECPESPAAENPNPAPATQVASRPAAQVSSELLALGKKHAPQLGTILKGKVVWMDNQKGYGFIKENETGRDYFCHYDSIIKPNPAYTQTKKGKPVPFRSLADGEDVEFMLEKETAKGKRGKKLEYKAVEITGPNGAHVKGVQKEDTINPKTHGGRQGPRISRKEQQVLEDFRAGKLQFVDSNSKSDAEAKPTPRRAASNTTTESAGVGTATPHQYGYYAQWGPQYMANEFVRTGHSLAGSPFQNGQLGCPSLQPCNDSDSDRLSDGTRESPRKSVNAAREAAYPVATSVPRRPVRVAPAQTNGGSGIPAGYQWVQLPDGSWGMIQVRQ